MSQFSFARFCRVAAVGAAVVTLAVGMLLAGHAEARVGGGSSFGSRGGRTFQSAPSTTTAPRVAPVERSMTQPGASGLGQQGLGAAAAPRSGFMSGGFGRALVGGLVGAGIFGLLSGSGLFGGLSGFGSMIGLFLQIGLIIALVSLALRFFRNRAQPAMAGMPQSRSAMPQPETSSRGGGFGGSPSPAPVIGKADYDAFEHTLTEIQLAHGREDFNALQRMTTPEMASFFGEQLAENQRRGVANRIADPRLLQGDLAEAWREPDAEYASVAMRFSMLDTMVDRSTGKVVGGDAVKPVEATELWTFRRVSGADWLLSAIQQG